MLANLLKRSPAARLCAAASAAALWLTGCGESDPTAPPQITYGVSVCVDCDMIISDERFASATIVQDDRGGATPLLFDDVGDQIRYERAHPDLEILARWVHDYQTKEWVRADAAFYVRSDRLHTPMASGIAAFAREEDARALATELEAEVIGFEAVWAGP